MNMTTQKDIAWVNTLKGGCILLVVLYHVVLPGYADTLSLLSAGQLPARLWLAFNQYLSPLRMPAFFFVSGLLAANAILNRPWKQVFTSRVTNLFYLYFLWGAIQWVMINGVSAGMMGEHLSDNLNAAWADSPWQFLKLMLLAMSASWYLYALALFFLVARLLRSNKPLALVLAGGLNYAAVTGIIPGWGPESLSQYFIFFLFGVFYSQLLIRWSQWRRDNLVPWALLLILALGHSLLGLAQNLFLSVLAILCCIAFCRWLNQVFSMGWLNWVGKNTLQIYVLHRIFIEFFGLSAILYAVGQQLFASQTFSLLWAVGFPPLMVGLCVGCSVGVWTLLNRGWGQSLFIYPKLLRMKFES